MPMLNFAYLNGEGVPQVRRLSSGDYFDAYNRSLATNRSYSWPEIERLHEATVRANNAPRFGGTPTSTPTAVTPIPNWYSMIQQPATTRRTSSVPTASSFALPFTAPATPTPSSSTTATVSTDSNLLSDADLERLFNVGNRVNQNTIDYYNKLDPTRAATEATLAANRGAMARGELPQSDINRNAQRVAEWASGGGFGKSPSSSAAIIKALDLSQLGMEQAAEDLQSKAMARTPQPFNVASLVPTVVSARLEQQRQERQSDLQLKLQELQEAGANLRAMNSNDLARELKNLDLQGTALHDLTQGQLARELEEMRQNAENYRAGVAAASRYNPHYYGGGGGSGGGGGYRGGYGGAPRAQGGGGGASSYPRGFGPIPGVNPYGGLTPEEIAYYNQTGQNPRTDVNPSLETWQNLNPNVPFPYQNPNFEAPYPNDYGYDQPYLQDVSNQNNVSALADIASGYYG